MFEQTFVETANKTRKGAAVFISFAIQVAVILRPDPDSADLYGSAAEGDADQLSDGAAAAASSSASASAGRLRRLSRLRRASSMPAG